MTFLKGQGHKGQICAVFQIVVRSAKLKNDSTYGFHFFRTHSQGGSLENLPFWATWVEGPSHNKLRNFANLKKNIYFRCYFSYCYEIHHVYT